MMFPSDKRFEIIDMCQRGLEVNRAVNRNWGALSTVFSPTLYISLCELSAERHVAPLRGEQYNSEVLIFHFISPLQRCRNAKFSKPINTLVYGSAIQHNIT
jgi:hypothetical protein